MASSAALPPENNQWSPSDAVAQGIAQEYSSQWHILEQLKSSVAVVDPFADTSKTEENSAGAESNSDGEIAENNPFDEETSKKADKEWFILPDAPSSGHASDAGSDSALDISDLRNEELSSFHSSNTATGTPSSSSKAKEHIGENNYEGDPYQEQWHQLDELKESVKALQWSSNASDSSFNVSQHALSSRDTSKKEDFAEPPKRSPVTNSNHISGSVTSFGKTDDESSFRSNSSSKTGAPVSSNSVGSASFPVQLTYIDQHYRTSQSTLYQESAIGSDIHASQGFSTNQNTSSDVSLESENLGFADLPNRPATIGNYGANDVTNTSPFGMTGLPLQPLTIQYNTSQNMIRVPSTSALSFSGNGSTPLMGEGSETLSKAPMSARERLQPDGRDGSEVLVAAPSAAQVVPSLVSYPLSAGSSNENTPGTGSQPSAGNGDLDSTKSSNLSQVGHLLVGGSLNSDSTATPISSRPLEMINHSNSASESYVSPSNVMSNHSNGASEWHVSLNNVMSNHSNSASEWHVSPSNVMSNHSNSASEWHVSPSNVMGSSPGIGLQLSTGNRTSVAGDPNLINPKVTISPNLQLHLSPEQVKDSQSSLFPKQQGTVEDHFAVSQAASVTLVSNTSWLSGGVTSTSQALIEIPTGTSNQEMGGFDGVRDAVMQKVEAHNQITDFGYKDEAMFQASNSFFGTEPKGHGSRSKLVESSAVYGALEAGRSNPGGRFVGNGEERPLSTMPAIPMRSHHAPTEDCQGSIQINQQGLSTSYNPTTQGVPPVNSLSDRQTTSNRYIYLEQLDRHPYSNAQLGPYNLQSGTTSQMSFPLQSIPSSTEVLYGAATGEGSTRSKSSALEDPHGRSRSQKEFFSRPTALDNVRSGLLSSEDDGQSPVTKLLGPNFKATQDYLNKLRNERLHESSFGSTGSSENESGNTQRNRMQNPFDNGLRKIEASNKVSKVPSSLSDNSWTRKLESKQAWTMNASDLSESRSDKQGLGGNNDQSLNQETLRKIQDISNGADVSSRSSSFAPRDKNAPSTAPSSGRSNSENDSYSRHSHLDSFPVSTSEVVHGKEGSLSRYETPLSSLNTDEKAWGQEAGRNKRTLNSTGSNSLMSSHDEAEDTDDLLSYEAVLEGDIKYIKQQKDKKQELKSSKETSSKVNFHSSSFNSKSSLTPKTRSGQFAGDISSINGSVDRDPLRRIQVSVSSNGSDPSTVDEETRRFHLSLGAGIVSPVVVSDSEKYQDTSEKSLDVVPQDRDDEPELSSDGIEIEEIEERDEEDIHNPSERSRESLTTESSSSSVYQPYIPIAFRQPKSVDRDSEITGNSSSTFGVYDIRHSSGPGSTNRRRKAMGLSPLPGRVSKPASGVVYVSPESSPMHSSMQEEVSTDEKSNNDTLTNQSQNQSNNDAHEKNPTTNRYSSQERQRPGSRDKNSSHRLRAHSVEDRGARKKRPSRDKEETSRSRSRGSHFEEAQVIDDYIGGRKLVQHGKPRHARIGSKEEQHSDESPSVKEYSTSTKNAELNQMWERFQESLKASPRYTKNDSVSSHLSRLSSLLSKPLDGAATSSETELDGERFRKPRSHSYASSSSEISTESDQLYNGYVESSSLSRQIKLRKLLETVNVADVPTFPRLRHRDTTTTATATSSALSDTSLSETPMASRNASHVTFPRPNRGLRKVSKTPVLVPSSQSRRLNPPEHDSIKPKCICAIHKEKPPPEPSRLISTVNDKYHPQRPRTMDVAVNVPSPKTPRRVRKKEGLVDVGVQTRRESDEEPDEQNIRIVGKGKRHHKHHRHGDGELERTEPDKPMATKDASTPNEKERLIASQNSPIEKHSRNLESSFRSSEGMEDINPNGSHATNHSKKEKSRSKHHRERHVASQNSPVTKSTYESQHSPTGPSWFYPMTNRHYSHPAPSSSVVKHNKPNLQSSVVKPDRLRFNAQTTKTFSPPAAPPSSSMQKLSLQEAFSFAKPDFIKRSRARLTRIEHNRGVRENGVSKSKGEERVSKMEIPAGKPSVSKPPQNPKTERLHRAKPRQMSKKEIKEMNLKLYNNLPEVKAQKAEDRRTAFYKTNRLRAKLYDKRVRENLKKRYAA